jgi:protein-L-isoaspartate(D-aspartate) O-methyltransferase
MPNGNVLERKVLPGRAMVEEQLIPRGIRDSRVLTAMARVPREEFVPAFLRDLAYTDQPLLIGYEQTISQPCIVAMMTEALTLEGRERVLEIGTGSGYQTAVLAELCRTVFSVERIPELSLRAELTLDRLGYRNIQLRFGNGTLGWPDEAPFDAIIVTAGAASLPPAFREQLVEGGRLVIPLGPQGSQVLHRFVRRDGELADESLGRVAFVPLVNEKRGPSSGEDA